MNFLNFLRVNINRNHFKSFNIHFLRDIIPKCSQTNHHNLFINTAITDDDIAYTVDVAEDAFRALRAAGQKRSI